MNLPFDCTEVSSRLLVWYGQDGRDLPWRHTRDPYHIWLSEIMLQQTTVAAVIPYYERFLARFPTLAELAVAPLDDVITLWAGLGYYSRARNLHRVARQLISERGGVFPDNVDELMTLPGIGRSTAGAICSIAFDQPAPILDGNVRRVLVRLFAWQDDPRSGAAEKQLWAWAEALTPANRPHDYAQAIMDLGATICTPKNPACGHCPLRTLCQAEQHGLVALLPLTRKQTQLPLRRQASLLIRSPRGFLLRQRPVNGFLGGLWEFPTVDLAPGVEPGTSVARLLSDLVLEGAGEPEQVGVVTHSYSHFKLELILYRAEVSVGSAVAEAQPYQWFSLPDLQGLAIHGAHKKAWQCLDLD